jgi:PAS domain S-box-containing protein
MNLRLNTLLARLLIVSGIPLSLFLVVALIGAIAIGRLQTALWWERHTLEVLVKALEEREHINQMSLTVSVTPLLEAEPLRQTYRDQHKAFLQSSGQLERKPSDNKPQMDRVLEIRRLEARWNQMVESELKARDKLPQLSRDELIRRTQALTRQTQPDIAQIRQTSDELIDDEENLLDQRRATVAQQTWESVWLIGAAVTLALVLGVVILYLSARSVTRPIHRLRAASGELLAGTFRVVPPGGPDEIAQLITHFNHMGLTLTERTSLLQREEERYRTYIGASAHILWTANPVGEVIADIPTWRAFTGQSEEEVLGTGWLDAIHPDDRPAAVAAWQRAVTGRTLFEMEYRLKNKGGQYRHVSCRAVPVLDAAGNVREWIGTCNDVTEKVQEAGLRQAKEAAEAANRAKSEFLARMSHELRTPLNAVIGMSKMLSTQRFGGLNAKQADYLSDITQAGEHLLNLVNDILDLAKVEAGRMDLHPEPFSLAEAVTATLSTLRPLAEGKKLKLVVQSPPADGPLRSDLGRFKQILYNLLSNAIKFTPAGSVTVTCQWLTGLATDADQAEEGEATAVRVEVRDTGIGIAPEDQTVIWGEFQQLKPGKALDQGGTGLGLALTRRLVQLLGGSIGLESQPGAGSTFTVVLPRRLPERYPGPSPADTAVIRGLPPLDRPAALVVEDYPPTNKLLCDWLRELGLSPVAAHDGPEGLAKALEVRPQLIVLDIRLPGMDGWTVLTRLKSEAETASIPVVIVTMTEDKQVAEELEVQEFFVKPVVREDFLRRLRRLVNKQEGVRVLVIDADAEARARLREQLQAAGLVLVEAASAREGLAQLEAELPDLVVIDPSLPDEDGISLIEKIRGRADGARLPILVLTATGLGAEEHRRLNGHIHSVLSKRPLTADRLLQCLRNLGLLTKE